jgi:uncharacterized protein YbjT (DUF2867 family)
MSLRIFLAVVALALGFTAHAETAFVAGGSGRAGIEVVRALQKAGFQVRASTRNAQRAAARYPDVKNWVEVNAHDPARLNAAVIGSDIVISTLGHADFIGPAAPQFVGYLAVRNIIEAAIAAKAKHVILITSSTAGHARGVDHRQEPRFGFVLYWKTKAEDFLMESGLPYTIVGPGGLADEFLVRLRAIEPPPPAGWGVKIMPRPEYARDFIDRAGVAAVVLEAIRNPAARGKAVAAVWDKNLPAGQISGSFADIPAEQTGMSYTTPRSP